MFIRKWRFSPVPDRRREFELAYSAGGPWDTLFRRGRGFHSTQLLPAGDNGDYLTIDRWTSRNEWNDFRRDFAAEYDAVDRECEQFSLRESPEGEFDEPSDELTYYLLDVFTRQPFGGNPVAVFPHAPSLSDITMQTIAGELNLSEVVFVGPASDAGASYSLRIFTPKMELPFAGHPTIGTAQLLVELGMAPGQSNSATSFFLQEKVGLVNVAVQRRECGELFTWLSTAQLPASGAAPPLVASLAAMLGISAEDILDNHAHSPAAWSAGVPYMIVPVRDRAALRRAKINTGIWRDLISGHWAPHLYVVVPPAGDDNDSKVSARMFAPAMGIAEDPATGAGAAALAGYLWQRDSRSTTITIEQGVDMGRPSEIALELTGEGGSLRKVRVGGAAVRVGEGRLRTPHQTVSILPE